MRRMTSILAILVLSAGFSFAADKNAKTFTGEIMDSQCAMMGSHAEMLKKEGMGNMNPNDPMAKKKCTLGCAKMGGKFVLFNSADNTVYQLDDQKKPEKFAGESVKVTGTLDEATKTIHVKKIQPGS